MTALLVLLFLCCASFRSLVLFFLLAPFALLLAVAVGCYAADHQEAIAMVAAWGFGAYLVVTIVRERMAAKVKP